MDIRVTPYPSDKKIISEPGHYEGWVLTVEIHGKPHSVMIAKKAGAPEVADLLRDLADKVRG